MDSASVNPLLHLPVRDAIYRLARLGLLLSNHLPIQELVDHRCVLLRVSPKSNKNRSRALLNICHKVQEWHLQE